MVSGRNAFDFVVGFSGDRVSPCEVMPYVRPALVDILVDSVSPWDAICKWATVDKKMLAHTPLVFIHQKSRNLAEALQIVNSHPVTHPWGFLVGCHNPACNAALGNVRGRESRHKNRDGEHGAMRLSCQACKFGTYVLRPSWIQSVETARKHVFFMPWPLTVEQRNIATGLDQTWVSVAQGNSSGNGKRKWSAMG